MINPQQKLNPKLFDADVEQIPIRRGFPFSLRTSRFWFFTASFALLFSGAFLFDSSHYYNSLEMNANRVVYSLGPPAYLLFLIGGILFALVKTFSRSVTWKRKVGYWLVPIAVSLLVDALYRINFSVWIIHSILSPTNADVWGGILFLSGFFLLYVAVFRKHSPVFSLRHAMYYLLSLCLVVGLSFVFLFFYRMWGEATKTPICMKFSVFHMKCLSVGPVYEYPIIPSSPLVPNDISDPIDPLNN